MRRAAVSISDSTASWMASLHGWIADASRSPERLAPVPATDAARVHQAAGRGRWVRLTPHHHGKIVPIAYECSSAAGRAAPSFAAWVMISLAYRLAGQPRRCAPTG